MFSSISKTTPQTQVSTSFSAPRSMYLEPVTAFGIRINGLLVGSSNVHVNAGDTVTAVVTTPQDYTDSQFYYYKLDNVPQSFAVVNRSSYSISVKVDDARKRWYIYNPPEHTLSFMKKDGVIKPLALGNNFNVIAEEVHVVLDPLTESVYFYNSQGQQISKVIMPAAPMDYVRIPFKSTVVVLVFGGEAYEIFLNSTSEGIQPFYSRRNYSEFTGDLGYVTRLPGEDLITYLRRLRSKKSIPPATCLDYNGTYLVAGGNGTVWVVDPNVGFNLIHTFEIDEYVFDIVALPGTEGFILVTQSQNVYRMDFTGNATLLFAGVAIFRPALFNGKVYIPEGDGGKLLVYNPSTDQFEAEINMPDFSPSYLRVFNNKLYVCGHDSERVLVFDSDMNYETQYFLDKVTWVSVVDDTIAASHYLKSYNLLNTEGLARVIGVSFPQKTAPVGIVGTALTTIKTLGNRTVYAKSSNTGAFWHNGRRNIYQTGTGGLLTEGDKFSVSFETTVEGLARVNCVIGDTAYDFDIDAVSESYYPRYIEFPLGAPGANGLHTRTFVIPENFTDSRMSIEYGSLKLNDVEYQSNVFVTAGDTVTIEIPTLGQSSVPVFTLGRRQFGIPVTTSLATTALTASTTRLYDLGQNSNFYGSRTLGAGITNFEFIVPMLSDVEVFVNGQAVQHQYYMNFSSNDVVSLQFKTSPKKFDIKEVLVIGPTNLRYIAYNAVDNPIRYLDYGTLDQPFVRKFDGYVEPDTVALGTQYIGSAALVDRPTVQFITANIEIAGIPVDVPSSVTVLGGESYLVYNGELITTSNVVQVFANSQLALARNVNSYYEEPVTVYQRIPTDDEDGFVQHVIGVWNINNKEVTTPTSTARDVYVIDPYLGAIDLISSTNATSVKLQKDKTHDRPTRSSLEQLDVSEPVDAQSSTIKKFTPYGVVDYSFKGEDLERYVQMSSISSVPATEISTPIGSEQYTNEQDVVPIVDSVAYTPVSDINPTMFDSSYRGIRLLNPDRPIQFNKAYLYNVAGEVAASSTMSQDKTIDPTLKGHVPASLGKDGYVVGASERELLAKVDNVITASTQELHNNAGAPVQASTESWNKQAISGQFANKQSRYAPPTRTIGAATEHIDFGPGREMQPYTAESDVGSVVNSIASTASRMASTEIIPAIGYLTSWLRTTEFKGQSKSDFNKSSFSLVDQLDSVLALSVDKIMNPEEFQLHQPSALAEWSIDVERSHEWSNMLDRVLPLKGLVTEIIESDTTWQGYVGSFKHVAKEDFERWYVRPVRTTDIQPDRLLLADYDWKPLLADLDVFSQVDTDKGNPVLEHDVYPEWENYKFKLPQNFESRWYRGGFAKLETVYSNWEQMTFAIPIENLTYSGQLFLKVVTTSTQSQQPYLKLKTYSTESKQLFLRPLSYTTSTKEGLDPKRYSVGFTDSVTPVSKVSNNWTSNQTPGQFVARAVPSLVKLDYENHQINIDKIYLDYEQDKKLPHLASTPFSVGSPYLIIPGAVELKLGESATQYKVVGVYDFDKKIYAIEPAKYQIEELGYTFLTPEFKIESADLLNYVPTQFAMEEYGNAAFDPKLSPYELYKGPADVMEPMQYDISEPKSFNIATMAPELDEHPHGGFSDRYVLKIEGAEPAGTIHMNWKLDIPEYYVRADLAEPVHDQGIEWDQDIDVVYGAFATQADARAAAQVYSRFNPILIMDTNLWSYRVLLDTGLVCSLPKGRYPIAWLIRGG